MIVPLLFPKQTVTSVVAIVALSTTGSVNAVPPALSKSITHDVFTASLIETWYVPAVNPVNDPPACQVVPSSIEYSYVPAPPDGFDTVIVPSVAAKHVTLVGVIVALNTTGSDMTTLVYVSSQLDIPSEAVTV